ncbi:MAG: NAD-dependent epimerase/dehydratase family protein [Sphingomonadales bacterium]|nr:NAD-dependent epimerase/dehydratase family protein [Sphingomonadales bacterium]
MTRKHVLLTGSSGMVGRNLMEHPEIGRFKITSPSRKDLELQDSRAVADFIESCKPDIIVHAAGKVGGIQANIREPARFLLENVQMGCNIVYAARKAGVRKLINLGSSCMYPRGHDDPLHESLLLAGELEPTNEGYALAKIAVSRLCDYIKREDPSYQYKTILPCNLYGRHDKFDPVESHLLPSIINKIYSAQNTGKCTVEIWGDGEARREFMYAGDLADAIVSLINGFDLAPSLMNIGLGYDYSVNDYYRAVADVMGFKGSFFHNLERPIGMQRKLLNVKLQSDWGWSPKVSLHEGIQKTYDFFLENLQK